MVIVGWEGERESVERRRQLSRRILRRGGAVPLGRVPGRSWAHGRFEGPHLRDVADRRGDPGRDPRDLPHLRSRRRALRRRPRRLAGEIERGGGRRDRHVPRLPRLSRRRLALLHVPDAGARPGAEIEQWRGLKAAACEAIVAAGRDDHPPPRGRPRPRPLHAGRDRRARDRRAAGRQVSARPGRDHEPRQARRSSAARADFWPDCHLSASRLSSTSGMSPEASSVPMNGRIGTFCFAACLISS